MWRGFASEQLAAGSRSQRSGDGWRPTAHYSALCRSYRLGCGAGELCEPHSMRWVPSGANRRRGTSRDRQRGTSCPKGEMSEANESTCGVTESRTVPCGEGWRGRSLSVVCNGRSRQLCEALELARCTLQASDRSALELMASLQFADKGDPSPRNEAS